MRPRFHGGVGTAGIALILTALLLVVSGNAAAALASEIAQTIQRQETLLAKLNRLNTRIRALDKRISLLQSDPVANAAAISSTEANLASLTLERDKTTNWYNRQTTTFKTQRSEFLSITGSTTEEFASYATPLRSLERSRATLELKIQRFRSTLSRLQEAPTENASKISDISSKLTASEESLDATKSQIALAQDNFSELEVALTVKSGEAVLTWAVPVTRADGSPLSPGELAGYEIYVLAESSGENHVITIEDPMASDFTVTNLTPDTYHFAISAKDSTGAVSEMSEVVSKTIAP